MRITTTVIIDTNRPGNEFLSSTKNERAPIGSLVRTGRRHRLASVDAVSEGGQRGFSDGVGECKTQLFTNLLRPFYSC
jgi:hypothetical protein